jgi:hypothetical protein
MGNQKKNNIEIGKTFHIQIGPGKPYKIHIISVIDDNGILVVYKYYGRHKQKWHYEVVHASSLYRQIEWCPDVS